MNKVHPDLPPIPQQIRDVMEMYGWDHKYDPWGSLMTVFFGLANALYLYGEDIPAAWEYHPAMGMTRDLVIDESAEEFECDREFLTLLESETVTAKEMIHAGNVLDRAADILRVMGRDY